MIINIFKRNGTKTRNGNTSIYSTRNIFFLNRNTQSPRQETKIRSLWESKYFIRSKTNHKIISESGILVHAPSLAPRTQIQSRHFFSVVILYLSVRSGCTNEASGLMPFFFLPPAGQASTFFRLETNFRLRTLCSLERINWGGWRLFSFRNHFSYFVGVAVPP